MTMTVRQCFALLAALSLVAGCGGGGGGGGPGPGPSPSPPPPPPPTASGTLDMTEDNVEAIALGVSIPEAALSVAQSGVNAVTRFAANSGMAIADCQSGGTIAVSNADGDNSFSVSSGDVLTITYTDCFDPILNGTANGSVTVALVFFSLQPASGSAAGVLSIPSVLTVANTANPAPDVDVSGAFAFQFAIEQPTASGSEEETISIEAVGPQTFAVEAAGFTEIISDFSASKTATTAASDGVLRQTIAFSLFYNSEILGGTFTCDASNLRFASNVIGDSTGADVICRGRNGSALRITGTRSVAVDGNGNGNFSDIGLLDWELVIDGFYRDNSRLRLADFLSDLPLRRIPVHANDLSYDATRDRLLIATRSSDPALPNRVIAVSLQDGVTTPLLEFSDAPNRVKVTADGTLVYVSVTGSPDVGRYDAATMQLLDTLTVTSDQPFSTEFAVVDLEISPADNDTLAVAFNFVGSGNTDVTFFDGTTERTNSYRDAVGNGARNLDILEFTSTGTRLFGAQSATSSATVLELDNNGAVSESIIIDGLGNYIKRVDDKVYSTSQALDEDSLVLLSSYRSNSNALGVDVDRDRVLTTLSGVLNVFGQQASTPLASYDLGLIDTNGIRDIVIAGGQYVLVDDEVLHLADVNDIGVENTDTCTLSTLMTQESEAYTRYDCSIAAAVYDPVRNKVYAAVSASLGELGNSIVTFETPTSGPATYLPVGSDPRQLALSADASKLYVIFDGSNVVKTIDLNTMTVLREQQLPVSVGLGVNPIIEPRAAMSIGASTIEPDTFIVVLGTRSTGNLRSIVAFRDGVRLPDEIAVGDLLSPPSAFPPKILFNAAGAAFSLHDSGADAVVHALNLGPNGLAINAAFVTPGSTAGVGQADISQNEIFTPIGAILNVDLQNAENRFDTFAPTFDDNRGGRAINVDVADGNVFVMLQGNLLGTGLALYDFASGTLEAEQSLESFFFPSFFNTAVTGLIDVGSSQLALVQNGLVIIDKSHVQ